MGKRDMTLCMKIWFEEAKMSFVNFIVFINKMHPVISEDCLKHRVIYNSQSKEAGDARLLLEGGQCHKMESRIIENSTQEIGRGLWL